MGSIRNFSQRKNLKTVEIFWCISYNKSFSLGFCVRIKNSMHLFMPVVLMQHFY